MEPRPSEPPVVTSQSARCLKVPSSHLGRRKIALTWRALQTHRAWLKATLTMSANTCSIDFGSRKTLMSTVPRDCWNCRVFHSTAVATLFLVTVAMRVLFTRECSRQKSGHMDKPVLNVRANLHKYKMKLFPVWGPRLCDESRSVLHFLGGGNHQHVDHATTSSCSLVLKARCQFVSWIRLGQKRCRCHDVPQLIHTVSRRS